jgi:hypothetical protein
MQYIPILITFLLSFSLAFYAYRRGLQDGIGLSKGKEIKPLIHALTKPQDTPTPDPITQGLMNILSYDGTEQKVKK